MNEAEKFLQEHLAKAQRPQPSAPQVQTTPFASGAQNDSAAVVGKQQMVSMGEAFKRFWVNWSLNGRSSRSEVWFVTLAFFLIWVPVTFIFTFLNATKMLLLLQILWGLVTFWPGFALLVRRLHDIGRSAMVAIVFESGYILWTIYVNIFGDPVGLFAVILTLVMGPLSIVILCYMLRRSQPHENRYGPVPNVR